MSAGLMCFLIKRAQIGEGVGPMLGHGLAGGLLGGAVGAVGGGLHGWLTAPDEVDEYTGEPKSKWDNIKSHALQGGVFGAGIGGLTGVANGWNEQSRFWHGLKNSNPALHDQAMRNWKMPNLTESLGAFNGMGDLTGRDGLNRPPQYPRGPF